MSIKFQDYYEVLGVPRDADAQTIQRAYRKLARKLHPDVNKEADASERFKRLAEAYEVLKDPEKRKRYDALGENWKGGQEFTPPPGFEGFEGFGGFGDGVRWQRAGGDGGFEFGDDMGGFSSFFESLFGGGGFGGARGPGARGGGGRPRARAGSSVEAEVTISLADAYHGAKRSFAFETTEVGDDGRPRRATRTYDVRIPPGTREGSTIRLQGQGAPGIGGGPAGDLFLRVSIAPDPRFTLDGSDLHARVKVAPHEAALGAKVAVPTIEGEAVLSVPPGSSSGKKLRLRGLGLPRRGGERGDLIATLEIAVPRELGAEERAAYEALARVATDPRKPS